ncbi:MAG: DUF7453 family protein, partial [Terriglobales bacterium]
MAFINDQGDVLFQSNLAGGSSNSGLFVFRGDSDSLHTVALQGQMAPGTSGNFGAFSPNLVADIVNYALGSTGEVAFSAGIDTGGTITSGLFRFRTDNVLEKIIARGDVAPDSGGGTLVTDTPPSASNVGGRYAFWAGISGGSITDAIYVTDPVAMVDLSITATDLPDPIVIGPFASVNYLLTVTNNGTVPATGVRLLASQTGITDSIIPSQGTCPNVDPRVYCDFGTILPGASATVLVEVEPQVAGSLVVSGSVFGNEADPNPANDSFTETTTVVPGADVSVTITDSPDPARENEDFGYTITVTNSGPNPATGVTLTDNLASAGLTFVSARASQGSCNATSIITCSLGSLAPGTSASVQIVVRAASPGGFFNQVNVVASEADPDLSNNSAAESTDVLSQTQIPPRLSAQVDSNLGAMLPNTFGSITFGQTNQASDFPFISGNGSGLFLRRGATGQTERLLQGGDPVPGIPNSRTDQILNVFINGPGVVAFTVLYNASDGTGHRAILTFDGTSFSLIAKSSDAAPGTGGAVLGQILT